MKKLILISFVAVATIIITRCNNNHQKEEERLVFLQDSIKIDNVFQSKIASLSKSIDSLLPFSERKKFRDDLNMGYREMVEEEVRERKAKLNYAEADYINSYLEVEILQSVKNELKENGYGPKYLEREYNNWATMHSKNPMMQQFLEEELSAVKWKYQDFKSGIK